MNPYSLAQKSALVTGAGSGIGRAIAIAFAAQGACVTVLDAIGQAALSVADEITALGGVAFAQLCDVADANQTNAAVEAAWQRSGRLDILVNNAGIAHVGSVADTAEEDFDRVYQVNVKGVANCLKPAFLKMQAQRQGVILNISSVAALMGIADRFAYSMSKGAVLAMTYSVAQDGLPYGIRCNALCPGRIHTPFVDGFIAKNYPDRQEEMVEKLSRTQPIGRMGTPEEIATAAVFLCSEAASFITGCAYPVDGGTLHLR